ncbi:MAG TPA: hemolysin family protein [Blastocatellia bacterium]|nr:hemolysin family protein [Blastocatellia bacterium]HMX27279.1 hemolysin family protein [Blastocatellia bacterium]HNG32839.1 hemolysin family protein [Blastocatellia bacterium]
MTLVLVKILAVLLLVLANGFFVAVEFALVSVRRSRIETLAKRGKSSAFAVLRALDHLDAMLSASQFGITLASLALGAVGESTLASLLEPIVHRFVSTAAAELIAHSVSVAIALSVITYFHLVLGEYAPKALAIEKAEAISLGTARWLWWFYRAFKPFIALINFSGIRFLKLFGVNFHPGHHTVYTEDELRHLVNLSHQSGHLEQDEKELIHNVFEFSDLKARQIMVPRPEVFAIESGANFDEVIQQFQTSGYSRLPVYEERFENIKGVVHSKDVMAYLRRPEEFRLSEVLRAPVFIPDSARLADVLGKMQREGGHLAIVVDEHGGLEGILTLEDLLEEIVGEIQDEHDDVIAEKPEERGEGIFNLDPGLTVREANRKFNLSLPESDDYHTVAGFLMARAGRLLGQGDAIEHNGARFTVERVVGRRITQVKMERQA